MKMTDKERDVAFSLLSRVYTDVTETAKKSGVNETILTEYITKMLGHCCVNLIEEVEIKL